MEQEEMTEQQSNRQLSAEINPKGRETEDPSAGSSPVERNGESDEEQSYEEEEGNEEGTEENGIEENEKGDEEEKRNEKEKSASEKTSKRSLMK